MNTEQREEIESAIKALENSHYIRLASDMTPWGARTLIQFARQQLNLRVDGEKLHDQLHISGFVVEMKSKRYFRELEALVLECLTTTPEEKE